VNDGPPVTVVDPRGAPSPAPARTPWTRTERLLAVALSLLLAVAVAAASDLASRPPAPYAQAVDSEVTLGDPAGLLLDVVLGGSVPPGLEGRGLTTDEGWSVVMAPEQLTRGTALVLGHDTVCAGLRPPTEIRVQGLRLPVRHTDGALRCDPAQPLHVVSGSLTDGPGTTVELTVVNASTRDLHVTGFRYAGFRFDAGTPLPQVLRGRDPSRPLRMSRLTPYLLKVTVHVADCAAARATLARAVSSERPDALPIVVDKTPVELTVKGLEVYLDLLRRATCVR